MAAVHPKHEVQYRVEAAGDDLQWTQTARDQDGVLTVEFLFTSENPVIFPRIFIEFRAPFRDIHSVWTPHKRFDVGVGLGREFESRISTTAPVIACLSNGNRNRFAIAMLDAENSHMCHYRTDDVGVFDLQIDFTLFVEPTRPQTEYRAVFRIDLRDIPFYRAIQGIRAWYDALAIQAPLPAPAEAILPVYSTWYSYHKDITRTSIVDECRHWAELGCKAVIVDDGWQCGEHVMGYTACGDWEVYDGKIDDMRGLVEDVHRLGMKFLLWYSVPFVGVRSQQWRRFRDRMLSVIKNDTVGILDVRYPEVRDYLVGVYQKAVDEWGLDGLKLDFVDRFTLTGATEAARAPDPKRDTESVQEAVVLLLREVRDTLCARRPDIMIEFRQQYIGPGIRRYGNMLRVGDCPGSGIINRVGIADLRLFSGSTAVHSDMIIWNPTDSVQSAAIQLISVLFGVPQISVRYERLSAEHQEMLKNWLDFWLRYRETLLHGDFRPLFPQNNYPLVEGEKDGVVVSVVSAPMAVPHPSSAVEEHVIVNGTEQDSLVVVFPEAAAYRVSVFDAAGRRRPSGSSGPPEHLEVEPGPHLLMVPASGRAHLSPGR